PRWSNDNLDTFIAIQAWDPVANLYYLYKAHVTGDDVTTPGFVPLTPGDSRLELVAVAPGYLSANFNGDGTKFVYIDRDIPTAHGTTVGYRVKYVGTDPTVPGIVIIDQASSGLGVGNYSYSPTSEQFVARAAHADGTKGIVSINTLNGAWFWL